ncbi:MAG: ATP synthase F0 subunit C [Bradymonadaceae bacterium]
MKSKKKVIAVLSSFAVVALFSTSAFAQEGAAAAAAGNAYSMLGWLGIAAGIGIGIASFGGAIGMGNAVASTLEGIARNPGSRDEVFVPFIIGLALIESLVIYAFAIAYLLQTNVAFEGTLQIAGG